MNLIWCKQKLWNEIYTLSFFCETGKNNLKGFTIIAHFDTQDIPTWNTHIKLNSYNEQNVRKNKYERIEF